jgi:hypothetical protein
MRFQVGMLWDAKFLGISGISYERQHTESFQWTLLRALFVAVRGCPLQNLELLRSRSVMSPQFCGGNLSEFDGTLQPISQVFAH